jgi:hypothetical protein
VWCDHISEEYFDDRAYWETSRHSPDCRKCAAEAALARIEAELEREREENKRSRQLWVMQRDNLVCATCRHREECGLTLVPPCRFHPKEQP